MGIRGNAMRVVPIIANRDLWQMFQCTALVANPIISICGWTWMLSARAGDWNVCYEMCLMLPNVSVTVFNDLKCFSCLVVLRHVGMRSVNVLPCFSLKYSWSLLRSAVKCLCQQSLNAMSSSIYPDTSQCGRKWSIFHAMKCDHGYHYHHGDDISILIVIIIFIIVIIIIMLIFML